MIGMVRRVEDSEIDFERVITDPIYRRKVIEKLKEEASGEVQREAAQSIRGLRERTDRAV